MKSKLPLAILSLSALLLGSALAADSDSKTPLLDRTNGFVAAFNKGDSAAMAEFWTPDGHYFDVEGKHNVGRPAIASTFAGVFSTYPGAQLVNDVKSTSFLDPDTIIEDGVMTVSVQGTAVSFLYTNINVQKDGKWLIASGRNYATPSSGAENLLPLKGLIGSWQDEGKSSTAEFALAPGGNIILGHYSIAADGKVVSKGNPRLDWDAANSVIRSRSIEADGGFSDATWTKQGDSWVIATKATLPDGKKLTETNIIVQTSPDSITLQSKDRKLEGGESLPDTAVISMKRVIPPKPAE